MTPVLKQVFLGVLLTLSMLPLPGQALAQATAGRMVVVPVASQVDTSREQRLADLIESALSARGVSLVSMHDARDRLQAQSRPPAMPDSSDLDLLAREARAAIEHVAFGRSAAAQRSVEEVFKRAERALESLNRETKTARNVLDACLALVRNTLARGNRQEALDEAMRCRRMVPDVAPSEFLHPASVIGVLAEADNQLRRMRIGQLSIESKPESGCAAYVNGRHLGVTPFRLDRAAEGEYRVQVECSRTPGRVHLVHLGEKPVDLVVDIELDNALQSDGRVALIYKSGSQARRLGTQHSMDVARAVRAEEAVLISIAGQEAELSRLGVSQAKVLGRTRLPWLRLQSPESAELQNALDALFEGRVDGEVPLPVATTSSPGSATTGSGAVETAPGSTTSNLDNPTHEIRDRRMRAAALAVASAGAGLLFAGISFEHQRADADEELARLVPGEQDSAITRAQQDYDRGERLRWLGVGGSALLGAAVPLLRVDVSRGVPWWSYALGVAGAGLATWGAIEIANDGACEGSLDSGACADTRESAGKGALLLSGAFPLLMFPVDHLIEWRLNRRMEVRAALMNGAQRAVLLTVGAAL